MTTTTQNPVLIDPNARLRPPRKGKSARLLRREDVVPSAEMVHQAETAAALLSELLRLWHDRRAHDGTAAVPALEVLQ